MKRLLIVALVVAGCGGTTQTSPPSASAFAVGTTPVATPVPPSPPPLTPLAVATAHISQTVALLVNMSDAQTIAAWIQAENSWLGGQPKLPLLNAYRVAVESSSQLLTTGVTEGEVGQMALDIIAAARDLPGVTLN
jgi:hypothetical protein